MQNYIKQGTAASCGPPAPRVFSWLSGGAVPRPPPCPSVCPSWGCFGVFCWGLLCPKERSEVVAELRGAIKTPTFQEKLRRKEWKGSQLG